MKKEKTITEYNSKNDFLHLGIIIIFFVAILIGLYYYDKQNDILTTMMQWLINSF